MNLSRRAFYWWSKTGKKWSSFLLIRESTMSWNLNVIDKAVLFITGNPSGRYCCGSCSVSSFKVKMHRYQEKDSVSYSIHDAYLWNGIVIMAYKHVNNFGCSEFEEFYWFCNLLYSFAARGVIILFPILGLSWAFCVIALYSYAIVWQYLFTIFASMQVIHKNYLPV